MHAIHTLLSVPFIYYYFVCWTHECAARMCAVWQHVDEDELTQIHLEHNHPTEQSIFRMCASHTHSTLCGSCFTIKKIFMFFINFLSFFLFVLFVETIKIENFNWRWCADKHYLLLAIKKWATKKKPTEMITIDLYFTCHFINWMEL